MNLKYTKPYMLKAACLALTVSLSFTACNEAEILNPVPDTSLLADLAFDTPSRIAGQINGIYTSLKVGNYLGGRDLITRDVRGEDFINRTNNLFASFDVWAHTEASGSLGVLYVWEAAYVTINSANLFLDGIATHPGIVSSELEAQYIAEAKFCRALSYHKLITLYAQPYLKDNGASPGVPLRLKGEFDTSNNDLARSTVAQVYAQILQDLNDAEAGLPANYAGTTLNTTRAHKNTAIALKTRVHLAMGNFPQVILEANKLVPATAPYRSSSNYANALNTSITAVFAAPYETTESIFSLPMTALSTVGGQSSIPYNYNGNREFSLNLTTGIMGPVGPGAAVRATDARKLMQRTQQGSNYLTKFPTLAAPFLEYIPVIRYPEVMLNLAEASAKTGDLTRAAALVTAIRTRSDATYTFPAGTFASTASAMDAIRLEKRIEFIGEGFRSDDLLRELLTIPAKSGGGLSSPAVQPTEENYILAIPNLERSTNSLILQ